MGKIFGINWIDWLTSLKNEKEEFIVVRILKIIDWVFFFHNNQRSGGSFPRVNNGSLESLEGPTSELPVFLVISLSLEVPWNATDEEEFFHQQIPKGSIVFSFR